MTFISIFYDIHGFGCDSVNYSTPWTSIPWLSILIQHHCLHFVLLIRFKVLFGSLYPHTRFCWWLSIFTTCFSGFSLCLCVHDREFLRWQVLGSDNTPLSKPWSLIWTTIVMKWRRYGLISFVVHVLLSLCYVGCPRCILPQFVYFYDQNQSACDK